ncbi:MAG TPA: M3 family oligoendopeptidase [Thermomicrobiaceae bacterium]|nr:M3 family oligoendopeptidase [Thermomicrobiaceae bacterium]
MTATRPTPEQFADATWDDILPLYQELAERPLDAVTVEQWLADWSAFEEALFEARSLASIAYTCDTRDPAKEAAHLRFAMEIMPNVEEQRVRLANRLLDLGYERDDLATTLRKMRTQRELFREENVPLQRELSGLNARYQKLTGGMTAEWEGEQLPLPRLARFLQEPDRAVRERAYRAQAAPYVAARDELSAIFDQQYALRQQVARNAGFANYRDYVHQEKFRYDYSPEDCETFHHAVETVVVPALARRYELRRRQLGVETLRPWDVSVDPFNRPPLAPYETIDELTGKAEAIFQRVDPVLGDYFATMRREELLDLESRTGKAPGGYCTNLPYRKRPFIFMNASGVVGNVRTLLHESGHAFHNFEAGAALPLLSQRHPGSEMAEVASMSMELLSAPYLEESEGGYFTPEEARRARVEHLEGILELLPWVATVDAFQQWLYTSGEGHDAAARDRAWLEIYQRFNPGVDWSGLEAERLARWYRQLHIFLHPFYYIEYGIAQLGALQVWRNALQDQARAIEQYRQALALGGSRPLPELFAAAGARLALDEGIFREVIGLVEEQLAALEA